MRPADWGPTGVWRRRSGISGTSAPSAGAGRPRTAYYQEVLELQKILGDEKGIGTTLGNLGNLRADAGEWDRARAYYLEALDLMMKTHDEAGKAVLFSDLGLVARETRQFDDAIEYYETVIGVDAPVG